MLIYSGEIKAAGPLPPHRREARFRLPVIATLATAARKKKILGHQSHRPVSTNQPKEPLNFTQVQCNANNLSLQVHLIRHI
jgi:hypothetical protein